MASRPAPTAIPERIVVIGCAGSGKTTARHAEIAELFARAELAHARRLRFTSPRQAVAWLASLSR